MKPTEKRLIKLIGAKLKEHRLGKYWTLEKVAKKSGIGMSIIQKYESGKVSIPLVKFVAHCKALKVDAGTLINDALASVYRRK